MELNGDKIKTEVVIAPLGTGTSMVTDGSQIKLWSDGGMLYIKSDTVSPLGVAVYGMLGNIVCRTLVRSEERTPTQIRECTLKIIEMAKKYNISFFIIGT